MTQHSAETKTEALRLYLEVGATKAAKLTGVPKRTINGWATENNLVAQATTRKQTEAANAASRVQRTWADFRTNEALAAGATANRLRARIQQMIEGEAAGRDVQAYSISYGIFIDKADQLNNQATQRIEVWAESELDRELRSLIGEMEDTIREHRGQPE